MATSQWLLDGVKVLPPPPVSSYGKKYYPGGDGTTMYTNTVNPRTGQGVRLDIPKGIGIEPGVFNYLAGQDVILPQYNLYNTSASGGGTSGGTYTGSSPAPAPEPEPLTWSDKYQLEGSPSWWKGMMPSRLTPETEVASIMNALIPYLSIEDQRQMASSLSRLFPDAFSNYSPEKSNLGTPTPGVNDQQREYFMSQQRAGNILNAMDKMKEASGKGDKDFGPGYQYVRQLASVMKDFGSAAGYKQPSRRQIIDMYSAFDPLLAEGGGEKLGAYSELARSIAQPFFGAGKLVPVSKTESGDWKFGEVNKSWF